MSRAGRTALSYRVIPFVHDLDTPLLHLPHGACFTGRDACNHVHIFGGTGSGKTSGSGKALATAYLRAGYGGLVCCAKSEEVDLWRSYARACGREQSLVLFNEHSGFNFIQYELARQGSRGVGSVIDCMMKLLEAADYATGISGQTSDQFWPQSIRQALTHIIPVVHAATGTVTIQSILDFVTSAATKPEQYVDATFTANSYAARTLRKLVDDPVVPMAEDVREAMLAFWFREYPAIPEKTRGNILISLSAKLDRFRHGRMRSCFCDRTTVIPELTWHGRIIVLAMPVLGGWNEDGITGQQLFKLMWMRATESRNALGPRQRQRPVFLWMDEAQYFLSPSSTADDAFLSTSRSARACVVALSQSLPSYYAKVGKDKADAVDGFIGKFSTHILHLNGCPKTNGWASQLIGRDLQWRATQGKSVGSNTSRGMNENTNENRGTNSSHSGGPMSFSSGKSEGTGQSYGANVGTGTNESESWSQAQQMDNVIEPRFFASELLSGGPQNHRVVTGVWFRAGARFAANHGSNWLRVAFKQGK